MTMRSLRTAILALLLPVAAGACAGDEEGRSGPPSVPVEATVVRPESVDVIVPSVGELEANARVQVAAETGGRVAEILFREGADVSTDQVLLRLDDRKLSASLQAAEASLARARTEARNLAKQQERNEDLLARGAISEQTYDDIRTAHEAAQARLEEAEAQVRLSRERLEDATIRAPFSGRIGERFVDVGAYVATGDPLFEVVDDDPLEMEFSVSERYVGRLTHGQAVSLTVQSLPDRTFRGRVTFVSPVVDPVNRTVKVKARIPNPAGELRAGQFANARLELETRADALMVPESAVVPRLEGSVVYLVRDGAARAASVELGARRQGRVQITSGVEAGDTVVVAGQQRLREESPVNLRLTPPRGDAPGGERMPTDGDTAGAEG